MKQCVRARARSRLPSPIAHPLLLWRRASWPSSSVVLRKTEQPPDQARVADQAGSKSWPATIDPDHTHPLGSAGTSAGKPKVGGQKQKPPWPNIATQRVACVHVRHTSARACTCIVTPHTLRLIRCRQCVRAHARAPASRDMAIVVGCPTKYSQTRDEWPTKRGRNPASHGRPPILRRKPNRTASPLQSADHIAHPQTSTFSH